MIRLIKNAQVFAPRNLGKTDVLISGSRILKIDSNISLETIGAQECVEVVDASGKIMVPGYVDTLVHITGGGGEGGFQTRTPEIEFDNIVRAGVTSLIGALGTDATTRGLADVYGKAMSLSQSGLNCFMYTGSYEVPVKTITGSIKSDMIFIEPVIGVGEIAISDKRSSQPTPHELARIASDAKVAGMIAGKTGIVMIHLGDEETCLESLHQAADQFAVALSQFYPTHINRNRTLFEAGIEFAKQGGTIDFTTSTNDSILKSGEIRASQALAKALQAGVPSDRLTMSSDAQGSLPNFDEDGILESLDVGAIDSLHNEMLRAVKSEGVEFSLALSAITSNPARVTGLHRKGQLKQGSDADLNLLDSESLAISSVMSRGHWLLQNDEMVAQTPFASAAT
ncbi:MAG: beta-aspartyl-peptidase [Candidatus Pelagadaptatus aseana]|uniref:beta-aspartyl-peptidase n=1 Tax=Candidatus Pelagadaptatus aseana TaxID=3120508 RepID=UPI0039B14CEB